MELKEYQEFAMRTRNKKLDKKEELINGVMGLCGESGEVIDIVKKHIHHSHDLDVEKLIYELGDVTWYIAEICDALGIKFEEILDKNVEKLQKRYPNGFEVERSINR